jgi:uncharacterized protein (TIGR03083 family)
MIPDRDVDCGEIYELTRRDLIALLRSCRPEELDTMVPATPEWSVHDVLSHLVGIAADLNAQSFGGDPDAWTAAQVKSRAHDTVDELAAEWDREAPRFEDGLRLFGYDLGSHFVGDLLQHVADVRHALGLAHPEDNETLSVALDAYLVTFEKSLEESAIGSVELSAGRGHWTLGSGPVVASVTGERYELFRALGGRRTAPQVRALKWSGDIDVVLPAVSPYPMPSAPIVEAG